MVGSTEGSSITAPSTARSDSSLCGSAFCCWGRTSIMELGARGPSSFSRERRWGASFQNPEKRGIAGSEPREEARHRLPDLPAPQEIVVGRAADGYPRLGPRQHGGDLLPLPRRDQVVPLAVHDQGGDADAARRGPRIVVLAEHGLDGEFGEDLDRALGQR